MKAESLPFSKWRMRLWPVHSSELPQFLPLFIIKFCVSFNYTILNSTKDSIVVTASGGGAEVIPVLKGGLVLGIAFCAMLLYSKLNNKLPPRKVFYCVLMPFLVFFAAYGAFLYPFCEVLSPHESAAWLVTKIGEGHSHWVFIYRYWMHALFFVFSELWAGMMIGLLFWGFANQITSVKSAARFYVLYTAGGHLGTIAAGMIVYYFSKIYEFADFNVVVATLMSIVVLVGGIIAYTYWWANEYVVPKLIIDPELMKQQNSNTKLPLKESLLYIVRSPYLGLIALMVIGYGLSVNMVEVSWKAILQIQHQDPNDYQAFMGLLQTIIGAVSLFISLFVGGNVIRRYGWHASAQLTPIVLGLTSLLFFSVYLSMDDLHSTSNTFCGISPLMLLVVVGAVHNVACKAMKYCLFDPTKEMAYIPLSQEAKIKGKAAVDLVGARFGKSGASWTQVALIDLFGGGSVLGIAPMLVPCLIMVVAFWIVAVRGLNKKFTRLQYQAA